jgi:hypothetical protein
MAQAYLGTSTGLTGIPNLLISDLAGVQDQKVQRALYQIQNWANSLGAVNGTTGAKTATLGTNYPGTTTTPAIWTTVSLNGVQAYIPVWT